MAEQPKTHLYSCWCGKPRDLGLRYCEEHSFLENNLKRVRAEAYHKGFTDALSDEQVKIRHSELEKQARAEVLAAVVPIVRRLWEMGIPHYMDDDEEGFHLKLRTSKLEFNEQAFLEMVERGICTESYKSGNLHNPAAFALEELLRGAELKGRFYEGLWCEGEHSLAERMERSHRWSCQLIELEKARAILEKK